MVKYNFCGVKGSATGYVTAMRVSSNHSRYLQEDRLRTETLMYFQQGSKSGRPGPSSLAEQQPLEPALAALRDSLLQQEHQLKRQASDLNKCLEVSR